METAKDIREKLARKATKDADFRALLLGNPKGAIEQELSITIPASMAIKVHEDSATTAHLVLPPADKLSTDDLRAVVGGGVNSDKSQTWTEEQKREAEASNW